MYYHSRLFLWTSSESPRRNAVQARGTPCSFRVLTHAFLKGMGGWGRGSSVIKRRGCELCEAMGCRWQAHGSLPHSSHANRFLTQPQLARSYLYKKNMKLVTSTSSSGQLPQKLGRYVEWPIPFFSPLVTAKTETSASSLPHQNSENFSSSGAGAQEIKKCEFSHANHQRAWGPRGFRREPNKLPASIFLQSLLTTEAQYTDPILFIALFTMSS